MYSACKCVYMHIYYMAMQHMDRQDSKIYLKSTSFFSCYSILSSVFYLELGDPLIFQNPNISFSRKNSVLYKISIIIIIIISSSSSSNSSSSSSSSSSFRRSYVRIYLFLIISFIYSNLLISLNSFQIAL